MAKNTVDDTSLLRQSFHPPRKAQIVQERGAANRNIVDPEFEVRDLDHLMRILQLNLEHRQKQRRSGYDGHRKRKGAMAVDTRGRLLALLATSADAAGDHIRLEVVKLPAARTWP